MCTIHLSTACDTVATGCQHQGKVPQVNKFEQVSSLDHQMLLAQEVPVQ